MALQYPFAITYLRYKGTMGSDTLYFAPGGGPARTTDELMVSGDPNTMTLAQLKVLILEHFQRNGAKCQIEYVTPLELSDDARTVEDWVKNPTQFQIDNKVKSENELWREHRAMYGKLCVNVYYQV
ncbi:MAG: hypothetical protein Homavirus30_6 [Homavirus sp.]|uniref:Uncharacterized protein n=1 Tax=Homavirus sp. TaxID=2487769 RepID=A0A3G5A748_9VIRU|nr:MAG: hypothetical protein Homavirus30_6 [Homavirus sp.]